MRVLKGNSLYRWFLGLSLALTPAQADTVPDSPTFYLAGNGAADRCVTSDCMCQVRPGPKPVNAQSIEKIERRYSAYFPTAVYELTAAQQEHLSSYLERMHALLPSAKATVMAYTDGCGTAEYNIALANKRLSPAVTTVKKYFSISNTFIHPEAPPECPLSSARRIDIIIHTSSRLTTAIDKIPADVYLIDASGSMWSEWRKWTDVINASYKPGARIYVSMTSGCRRNQTINSVSPKGGTEIWYSYYQVLDFMQPGETLAIISDFQSDVPLLSWEHALIQKKVSQKGIKVIAVRL
jgi:hypothetical protein